CKQAYDVPWTF
nr:immunoglobulin light chain junction region [Mus musculus]NSL97592.1 immunoglobulin light chain junction region [Mus musculus]NSL99394.1 immunoglobulin light chain junction region [Mus musculus]NSL99557.1 immunoglobulin light chain junction region [Mus musculus]NSL99692.1 immunoglobulin light chain junction region [Mus musculus]